MSFEFKIMTQAQIEGYLSDVRNATLATIKRDGGPQLSSIWYLYEAGVIYIKFGVGSAKYHNIKRDQRVSMCVDGGSDDSRTVTIYGDAKFMNDEDLKTKDIKKRINLHYSGSEAEAESLLSDEDGELKEALIAIVPTKTIALDYNG